MSLCLVGVVAPRNPTKEDQAGRAGPPSHRHDRRVAFKPSKEAVRRASGDEGALLDVRSCLFAPRVHRVRGGAAAVAQGSLSARSG